MQKNEIFYFHSFGVEHIPEEIKEFIDLPLQNKNIIANIFRLQANDSVICGYFCIGFIDFMLVGKKLTDYTSLFSPHDLKKKGKINLSEQTKFRLSEIIGIGNYFLFTILL